MDFLTTQTTEANEALLSWYRINFHADFGQYLKDYGRLPYDSIEDSMKAQRIKDDNMQVIITDLLETKMRCNVLKRNEELKENPTNPGKPSCILF